MTSIRKYLIGAPAHYLLMAIPNWTEGERLDRAESKNGAAA